ncbi:Shedu immune nuclease family protein [Methylobacterium bullatum]|uniref:Shedu protein SduA C-terminal domain-containing protein n=1 Tax=Methylobacterium bullatum TaxID=570505 RepID=A0AAV4Z3I5_9HYPH|nr:Shedu immune nuclease family protein [Methylobacterium bullatum]MBD8902582.1 hypothetical protein [Methylobacterium bullatum]GJD38019.1 hypothetical protein OICFNHDK_0459 [Methylobacterium bullatum]
MAANKRGREVAGPEKEDTYTSERIAAGRHAEDDSFLVLENTSDGKIQYLSYHLSVKAYDRAKAAGADMELLDESSHPCILAEYSVETRVLTTYPIWLRSNQTNFLKRKYGTISRISFEGENKMEVDKYIGLFFGLPTGFHRKPFEGFGVDPRIKYLIDAFRNLPGIVGITMCDDDQISVDGDDVRLPVHIYDYARLNINRAHDAARDFANGEKMAYLKNLFMPYVVPGYEPNDFERPGIDLQDTIQSALAKKGIPRSRNTNNSAAVRSVMRQVAEIAQDDPVQLFELSEKIQLASLSTLIDNMTKEMAKSHREVFWQTYFEKNSFILKVLFGLPVVYYTSQATVGGMGLKRKGEKQADFLVQAGMLGNLAIVEIKTTETPLLTRDPYRPPSLYGPHPELTGGTNQLVDQKLRLIKGIAAKKEEDEEPNIQAWSVPCILIIGRLPEKKDEKRSFEIYRGSQKDVLIITFDELLAKLVALHEFLVNKPSELDEDIAKLV